MKFADMKYERPDFQKTSGEYEALLNELEHAPDAGAFANIFQKIDDLRSRIATMSTLCEIRHSINTKDEFYDQENDYWDETNPLYAVYDNRLSRICLSCPFREELYDAIPKTYFLLAECNLKSFSEEIVPLLQKENKLASEYGKLKASARIEFEGEVYNLSTISTKAEDTDRSVRKGAMDAKLNFYAENEAEFDRIYDGLVKVRTEIARKLGYSSFTELAYMRMTRLDYDRNMVANYRRQILEDIVPSVCELYRRQAKRLGTETVAYYDKAMDFADGNPTPKGSYEDNIAAARVGSEIQGR